MKILEDFLFGVALFKESMVIIKNFFQKKLILINLKKECSIAK